MAYEKDGRYYTIQEVEVSKETYLYKIEKDIEFVQKQIDSENKRHMKKLTLLHDQLLKYVKIIDPPKPISEHPCITCGTQQPCPENGCESFKKYKESLLI
jgi:hypothetical protein